MLSVHPDLAHPENDQQSLPQPNQEQIEEFPHVHFSNSEVSKTIESLNKMISMIQGIDTKHEQIFRVHSHQVAFTDRFMKLIKALKLLQIHFYFILDVLSAASDSEIPSILKKYSPVAEFYQQIKEKDDLCLYAINESIEVAISFVVMEVEKATDLFFSSSGNGEVEINVEMEFFDHIQIATSKVECVLEYFPGAITFGSHNIFAQPRDSEVWQKLWTSAELVKFADPEGLQMRFNKLWKILRVCNALLLKSHDHDLSKTKDTFLVALSGFYYGYKQKEAELKSSLYLSNPKMETAFQIWNFQDKECFEGLTTLKLPKLDYDKKVYLHRLFPSITKEVILKEYEEGSLNTLVENTFTPPDLLPKRDLIIESIFNKQADAIPVRIMAPYPLVLEPSNVEKSITAKAIGKVSEFWNQGKTKPEVDGIIIHMHGGGFVSGASNSHRPYLYKWAKNLNKVIFSIDYRLAPDHPYPAAIDDCWQVYNWIINYAETILGIKTKKIIVAGDSAGGNLALALTLRAIKMGIRVPDGCFLSYAALSMYPKKFVPSYWKAIEDMVLPHSILKLCIQAYIPDIYKPIYDPFLSPVEASDELLSKLPPVRIITGNTDPLHDINWRFLHRMQGLNKDVKMKVYDMIPHAFLSFDQVDECIAIVENSYQLFRELFNEGEKQKAEV